MSSLYPTLKESGSKTGVYSSSAISVDGINYVIPITGTIAVSIADFTSHLDTTSTPNVLTIPASFVHSSITYDVVEIDTNFLAKSTSAGGIVDLRFEQDQR